MILLLPEVKKLIDRKGVTRCFGAFCMDAAQDKLEILELATFRFWDKVLPLDREDGFPVEIVKGLPATEVIDRLKGIRCGMKSTSCPDQLARALELMLKEEK